MLLVINTYGSFLKKEGECFSVKTEDKFFEVSSQKVSSIIISTSAYLTTDAIKLAIENNIDIVFLDEFGNPFARIWHPKVGSTAEIRRKQLEIADKKEGLQIALQSIKRKFNNQVELLKKLRETRPQRYSEITYYIEKLLETGKDFDQLEGTIEENRQKIMGIEGTISRIYFESINKLMPEKYKFQGRSRNPAIDEFNCLLNYAYGVLYSRVERACIIAGLDPYIGFLHTDNYNKKSFVFDLIENYRQWADEVVISLFAGRKVKDEMFDKLTNGFSLNKKVCRLLL